MLSKPAINWAKWNHVTDFEKTALRICLELGAHSVQDFCVVFILVVPPEAVINNSFIAHVWCRSSGYGP